jgi:sugar O-acyltransferase (sialic acid O-acetyltransferase NeuD family)
MFTNKVIIFGLNDLAELAWYYLTLNPLESPHPVAFTVSEEYLKEPTFKGLPVIPFEKLKQYFSPSEYLLFAPIANNEVREKIYNEGKNEGYNFLTYISPKCTNYASSIGENCFIFEDNTLQPFTTIENNVIIWSGNHIGHHGIIEDNVFFSSHVVMSGHCHIKKGAFLGVNSTLRDGITIGENSIVGMGSVVTKSIPNNQTWVGSPAKLKI